MNYFNRKNKNSGFTIIEAMVAIFILSVSVATMLGITASSAASARYANNEITANYLLQEAVDSIRNSRDTMVFQHKLSWTDFLNRYGYAGNTKCFPYEGNGCFLLIENFDPANVTGDDVENCDAGICPNFFYDNEPNNNKTFYNYTSSTGYIGEFRRTINMDVDSNAPDQLKVTVNVEWYNGSETNKRSQSLTFYLLNWQKS
ncbi:MAG: prepilin-type N-terminal cleavage/methylation domain-containing protein [Candidatus Nomurabacteria bacterium]